MGVIIVVLQNVQKKNEIIFLLKNMEIHLHLKPKTLKKKPNKQI